MSSLLLGIGLSVHTCWFYNMITYFDDLFLLILAHADTGVHCLILPGSSHILKCT